MFKKCKEEGKGKTRMVSQLMGWRKATLVVINFKAAMRADKRAQRLKQKTEKQKSERDEAWAL